MNRPHDPGGGVNCVRSPIPRKDQITKLPLVTEKTSNNGPAWTQIESTKQTESNFVSRNKKLAVKEAARSEIVLLRPNCCQKSDKKDRGLNLGTRPSIPDCCEDGDIQMSPGHHSVMSEDMEVEPGLIRMCPVRRNEAPKDGEKVRLRPVSFLDAPANRLTDGFLKLAEEARHSEGVDDQPPGINLVHSQHSGRTGRTLIMEIEHSFPESGSEELGGYRTSSEVITDVNMEKPVVRLGPLGQDIRGLGYTQEMAKPDPVGPYEDRDTSVPPVTDRPAGLVRIRHPEGSYEVRDISVPPVNDGPAGLVRIRHPEGSYEDRDISVPPVNDGPAGLVRIRHPEGSYEVRDISVPPVSDGPAGLVRIRHPEGSYEVRDRSVSPVNDRSAGLVRIRHPEGSYEDRDTSVPPVTDRPAGLVRIRHPEGSYEDRNISVSPVNDGPAGLVRIRHPEGSYEVRDRSVSPVTDGSAGLVRIRHRKDHTKLGIYQFPQ